MPFVHLRVHSHFSLLASSIRLDDLVARAKAQGASAIALTDDGSLFGAIEFTQAARAAGVRPIIGCDLYVTRGSRHERPEGVARTQAPDRLVVLCESAEGYASLIQLSSMGYLDGLDKVPRVDDELLRRHHAGLIALAGGVDSEIGAHVRAGRRAEAEAAAIGLRDTFGAANTFLRLEDHGDPFERELIAFMAEAAPRLGVGLVVTNDCRFTNEADLEAYRALWCIGAGATLEDPISRVGLPAQHLRSPEDMEAAFAEFPNALRATLEIAERCRFAIPQSDSQLPDFAVPEDETLASFFRRKAREGLDERRRDWAALPPGMRKPIADADYDARLDMEMDIVARMGFEGYFLVVWDLFRHAREHGIPVGPGRGSAAGSLVSYALRITDLDPLQYGLLFERFLNPGRKSLPDIDMDFCQRRRGELIRYVQQKYGEDRVAQIITFGTLNARSVIRDVGRVMNMSFGEVDRIAKLVPEELNITLDDALRTAPALGDLRRSDPRVSRLLEIALSLEGLARNAGVHAAGVIIAPRPLLDLVPLFKTNKSEVTTQFAMGGCEAVGLVKMDFLGLKTLTVLDDAAESAARATGTEKIRLEALPLDDQKTFDLFRQARTSGVFQFESSGMRDILRRLSPESLEDLIALNALYRPGPMQFIDSFIARRRGRERVVYPHPLLEGMLKPTMGIMVYQEQVMQASRQLAGFSQSEADDLRKAMGKKKPEVMAAQKEKFVRGATEQGVREATAAEIFDAMEKFAGYAFNRAHSACYALVAYWSAWLKANHPAHFMAALLTSERDHTVKVVRYIAECREMGIEVLPPDVNESDVDFTVVGPSAIRFGLSAIKGVGRGAVASILDARRRVGRFRSLHSFCAEIDLRLNNRKVLEALVKAGALDSVGSGRSTLMFSLDAACDAAASIRADRESGQASLFGAPPEAGPESGGVPTAATRDLPRMPEWTREERLRHEKEVLGFYVSGHPLQEHAAALSSISTAQVAELSEFASREATVAGIVVALRKTRTKKGDWMAFVTLEDMTGTVEVIVFPAAWNAAQSFVTEDAALCVKGQVEMDGDRGKILAETITPLIEARQQAASGLLVRLPPGLSRQELDETCERVGAVLANAPGTCPVHFELVVPEVGLVTVQAGASWAADPVPGVIADLEAIVGGGVSLTFG